MQFLMLFGFILLVFKSIGSSNVEEMSNSEMEYNSTIVRICVIVQEILPYIGYVIIVVGILATILL